MATYISDDPKLLDELFRKDGEGQLLVGYETGKEKPHADSSYMLYPANPDRQDPVYTFMALFSQQSIKAKYSAFVPNTRLEIYSFPKMTDVPAISGDISKKEYINQVLLPYIREKGLAPLISTNLRNVLFAQSRSSWTSWSIFIRSRMSWLPGMIIIRFTNYRCMLWKRPKESCFSVIPKWDGRD